MALQGAVGEFKREGKVVVCGSVDLDGSNPTPVATGLAIIDSVALSIQGSDAPGTSTSALTWDADGGTLNVYAWKPTATGDSTLAASDGTETVSYTVYGRRRT